MSLLHEDTFSRRLFCTRFTLAWGTLLHAGSLLLEWTLLHDNIFARGYIFTEIFMHCEKFKQSVNFKRSFTFARFFTLFNQISFLKLKLRNYNIKFISSFLIKFAFKRQLFWINKMRLCLYIKFLLKVLPRTGVGRQIVYVFFIV